MKRKLEVERERRNRIVICLYAYAYEMENISLAPDHEFDALCLRIKPEISTGHKVMDEFFRTEFSPSTGMWIHKHPEIAGIKRIFESITSRTAKAEGIGQIPKMVSGPLMNGRDLTGYNSNTMNMLYLRCLGFPIVPGLREHVFEETGTILSWDTLIKDNGGVELIHNEEKKFVDYETFAKLFFKG